MHSRPPASRTVADIGEFALIDLISERLTQGELVFVGPGDDAAVLRAPRGHVVVSTDLLVQGTHFRREWGTATEVGHRAAAQNLADIAAMGGKATALTLGLGLPSDLAVSWVLDFVEAFAAEASMVGASVIGGDITRADQIVLAVSVLGACDQAPVMRGGARPGDVVAIAGRQGWSAAGLAVLGRGFRSPRVLVEAFLRPEPPYAAGPAAAVAGATAMIDVSDGLLADLGHIARASGVLIDIEKSEFDLAEPLLAVGSALGVDPMQFILAGGEDHSLVATFPPSAKVPDEFRMIGWVHEVGPAGAVVTVDGEVYDGPTGHTHF